MPELCPEIRLQCPLFEAGSSTFNQLQFLAISARKNVRMQQNHGCQVDYVTASQPAAIYDVLDTLRHHCNQLKSLELRDFEIPIADWCYSMSIYLPLISEVPECEKELIIGINVQSEASREFSRSESNATQHCPVIGSIFNQWQSVFTYTTLYEPEARTCFSAASKKPLKRLREGKPVKDFILASQEDHVIKKSIKTAIFCIVLAAIIIVVLYIMYKTYRRTQRSNQEMEIATDYV